VFLVALLDTAFSISRTEKTLPSLLVSAVYDAHQLKLLEIPKDTDALE
jgi:hypothetical protein